MPRSKLTSFRSFLSYLLTFILRIAYSAVKIFIFVGEITQKIIVFVILQGRRFFNFLYRLLHDGLLLLVFFIKWLVNGILRLFVTLKSGSAPISFNLKVRFTEFIGEIVNIKREAERGVKRILRKLILFKKNKVKPPKKEIEIGNLHTAYKGPPQYLRVPITIPIRFPKIKIKLFSLRNLSVKIRYLLLGCSITVIAVFLSQSYFFVKSLPSPNNIGKINYPLSTHIYDRNGRLLYEFYREQNRTPIKLKDLPSYISEATISFEDKDFYRHKGVSPISGIARAIKEIIRTRSLQGGSTITQQLVKSALLTPERTIERKVKEIILAIWAEHLFTKQEILEMYLNQVSYGGPFYGIEEASRTYFGKHASELTLSEAALLAGLPQAPSLYSPYVNPQLALIRRNEVLEKMKEQGYISPQDLKKSQSSPLAVIPPKTNINAPHFVFYVKSLLEEIYGVNQVEEGGLRVTTTLDLDIQREAEKIVKEELEKVSSLNVGNGALLVTRPSTGEILAMVGSKDYFDQPYGAFNVTTALRQPGSSIKPLMYALALQKGFTAATIIQDTPTVFNIPGSVSYRPVNYDGRFHGSVPLRYALANSYNIPAVKTLDAVGVENFVFHARKLGISTWYDTSRFGLSLTLGGGEVTMIDMVKAFGVLANQGYRNEIMGIQKIENSRGELLYEANPFSVKVLNEGISYIISDILSDNFARRFAFGTNSALEIPGYIVAVKTGTTDSLKDNWTLGYTPNFLVSVWVGNNDGTPMNPYLTSGITGAAPIWNKMMGYMLQNYKNGPTWYKKPDNVIDKQCYFGRREYFLEGTENTSSCRETLFTPKPSGKKDD